MVDEVVAWLFVGFLVLLLIVMLWRTVLIGLIFAALFGSLWAVTEICKPLDILYVGSTNDYNDRMVLFDAAIVGPIWILCLVALGSVIYGVDIGFSWLKSHLVTRTEKQLGP